MEIRVRYAPSPTGYLHIGGARTAIFNYLFARHNNGKFIVRIEDTDLVRNIADGISSQLDNLRWLGLEIDETIDKEGAYGPYQQTERLEIYQRHAETLITENHAYYCFCTPEEITKMREKQQAANITAFKYDGRCEMLSKSEVQKKLAAKKKFSIRLKVPENKVFAFNDMVRGTVKFNTNDLGDFIIIKSNGVATYNFAVVVDDHLMKISHVLRGEEHLSNTPRQLLLYDYFGWTVPQFGHLTLIINNEGKKLSKRDGQLMQFIEQYRKQGFLAPAIFNFITLLGWNSHEEREIYSQEELIKIFNSKYFSKAPSMFDQQKLLWMNNYYIKNLSAGAYLRLVTPFVQAQYDWKRHKEMWWQEMLLIYHKQLMYGAEITDLISLFFKDKFSYDKDAKEFLQANNSNIVIEEFFKQIKLVTEWEEKNIKFAISEVKRITKVGGKLLFMPIRIVCTGQMHGPELPQTIKLLGKKTILTRVKEFLA